MRWLPHEIAGRSIAGAFLTCALLACGHSTTGVHTGSLTVTITAPGTITPSVTVNGPSSYTKKISATTTLTGLPLGTYTVTAAKAQTAATIVSVLYAPTVSGSPVALSTNATATVQVTYAQVSGSGYLWSTTSTDTFSVVAFDPAKLSVSGSPIPAITIQPTNGSMWQPQHTAFDSSGRMWVENVDTLTAYTGAQLATSGAPKPTVVIQPVNGSLAGPFSMAFDAAGYLWVGNLDSSNVVAFSPQQLSASGAPAPAITLTSTLAFFIPEGLAFDKNGNLWVSSWAGGGPSGNPMADTLPGNVQEFTASQISQGGAQTPTITLTGPGLEYVSAIAFDVSGNLWLTNDGDSIVEYSAGQIAAGGAQTPAVTILVSPAPCSFSGPPACKGPDGLAFDNSGNLWVAYGVGSTTESIVEYSASQLTTSGTLTPTVTLTANGPSILGTAGLTFYPHATGLPINPSIGP